MGWAIGYMSDVHTSFWCFALGSGNWLFGFLRLNFQSCGKGCLELGGNSRKENSIGNHNGAQIAIAVLCINDDCSKLSSDCTRARLRSICVTSCSVWRQNTFDGYSLAAIDYLWTWLYGPGGFWIRAALFYICLFTFLFFNKIWSLKQLPIIYHWNVVVFYFICLQ